MKRFYYTNPTSDRHRARVIQGIIERATGLELVNPFYNKYGEPTEEIAQLDKGLASDISSPEIVYTDLKLVKDSDGIVGWFTNKSNWGSISEVIYCYSIYHKPVYLIFDPLTRGGTNSPDHPFVVEHITKGFRTVDEFIEFAKANLCG